MLNINVMKSIFLNLILIVFNLLDKVARGRLKPFILEKFQENCQKTSKKFTWNRFCKSFYNFIKNEY